ncbi:MAG: MotA/TolQ/ExbB proton channel family protein [Rickettsiales bacterium]|nr:MotA/TolQ/ExbB proton channel family protein [Pseudomonadota bacterium]MDA0966156.1 MotA/TolQ/ExbB proton channel family protein [Pseudomonadota bacterium]MDG4543179.1 MotA/TolQ/ExbB proton channel family protein [Rickettsiales bacterium]MDG4545377.1 MotA/TolQ/ExbB proton channel family protein [Rickettsiales bacterium]MDG4547826.1 MotA/TolQ/ExbB proton channel family protein [Rickettsiales bacterium]
MILTELLEKGGAVMAILLLLSVYVVSVIFYKIYQFWSLEVFRTDFLKPLIESVESQKLGEASRIAGNQRNPIARVIETALRYAVMMPMTDLKRERAVEASGSKVIRTFESHLRGLEMVANIAPLLGLLGTVIGMVKAFAGIHQVGSRVDPSVLAGGIWEALLTTVAGLMVAIPAIAAHYIIDGKIEEIRSNMKESVSSILSLSKSGT